MFESIKLTDQPATFESENKGRVHSKRRLRKSLKRLIIAALAAAMVSPMVGCRSYQFAVGDAVMLSYRDMVWARRAYNLRYGNLDRPYGEHFYNGFCAGYADVMNGGDGYVPALPPVSYRGPRFQSTDGLQCVNAWFEGFPAGVKAAKQENVGDLNQVPISKMMEAAIEMENKSKETPRAVTKVEREPQVDFQRNNHQARPQNQIDLQTPPMPSMGDFSTSAPNLGWPVSASPATNWPNSKAMNSTLELSKIPADFGHAAYPVTNAVAKEFDAGTKSVPTNQFVPSKLPPIVSPSEVFREAKEFSVMEDVSPSQSSRRLR